MRMNKPSVLARAKTQLVLNEPFYATILLGLEIVETQTLGNQPLRLVATDGTRLYINPVNFEKLTVAEGKGVLKHEVMHVAQLHPFRGAGKDPARWNQATDDVINPIIMDEGGSLPSGVSPGVRNMSAEQRYNDLPPSPPKGGGGQAGPDNPLGNDVLQPPPGNSSSQQAKVKQLVAQAAAVAKARGKLPAELQEQIDSILNPKVDWKEQLRDWLTERVQTDYSWRRPNRRFLTGDDPMYLPSMDSDPTMDALAVVLDTSGSITMNELKQGLGEVCGAIADVAPKRLLVVYCDAKVQHCDEFDNPQQAEVAKSFTRHGRGGTHMPAALTWLTRNHPEVKGVIVWTDGETSFGDEDAYPFPVLWAISNPRITADWGITLHVEVGR